MMRWKHDGQPCPVHVSPDYPRKRTKCGKPVSIAAMASLPVGERNGPQGAWSCPDGHCGWIWMEDCYQDEISEDQRRKLITEMMHTDDSDEAIRLALILDGVIDADPT